MVQLIVNNGFSDSNPATVTITAANDIILPANVQDSARPDRGLPGDFDEPRALGRRVRVLVSGDPSKVTLSTASLFFAQGTTTPGRAPTVTGVDVGSSLITASPWDYRRRVNW